METKQEWEEKYREEAIDKADELSTLAEELSARFEFMDVVARKPLLAILMSITP